MTAAGCGRAPSRRVPRRGAALAYVVAALVCGRSTADAQTLTYLESRPLVVSPWTGGLVHIEATIAGQPTRVLLKRELRGHPRVDIDFRDDGLGGDRIAGDRIYTVAVPAADVRAARIPNDVHRVNVGLINIMNGSTVAVNGAVQVEVYTPEIPALPVYKLSPTVQMTERLVNIHDPAFHADLNSTRVLQTFYARFGDDYDFVNIVSAPSRPGNNRTHRNVGNDVAGTGFPVFTSAISPRLKGINDFPVGPIFDGATQGYTHEVGHQWIEYLNFGSFALGSPGLHWPLSSMASGVMGYNWPLGGVGAYLACHIVVENGAVRLRPKPNYLGFSDLDLYLMGLMAPEEVGPQVVFVEQSEALRQRIQSTCDGRVSTDAVIPVSVADIVAGAGPRLPGVAMSQKRFRIATILVSRDGLVPLDVMWLYGWLAHRAELQTVVPTHESYSAIGTPGLPFHVATRGRASLDTRVTSPGPLPPPVHPRTPTGLRAAIEGARVTLTWDAAVDATSYRLAVGSAPGLSNLVNAPLGSPTTFVADGVPLGAYYVRVHGVNGPLESGPSNEVLVSLLPQVPTGLRATVIGNTVVLAWNAAPGATSYRMVVGSRPGGSDILDANVGSAPGLTAPRVPPGTYYVRVHGVNGATQSAASDEVRVDVAGCVPPVAPAFLTVAASGRVVILQWAAVSGATRYIIEAGSAPGLSNFANVEMVLPTPALSAAVPPGTYHVRVRARTGCGVSPPSPEAVVTVAP